MFTECSFTAQKPIQTRLELQDAYNFFTQKFEIFFCFDP